MRLRLQSEETCSIKLTLFDADDVGKKGWGFSTLRPKAKMGVQKIRQIRQSNLRMAP